MDPLIKRQLLRQQPKMIASGHILVKKRDFLYQFLRALQTRRKVICLAVDNLGQVAARTTTQGVFGRGSA